MDASFDDAIQEGRVSPRRDGKANYQAVDCARCGRLIPSKRGRPVDWTPRYGGRQMVRYVCIGCEIAMAEIVNRLEGRT